mmetsp:Transcript_3532/g.7875  ORF Transcript_3532/g.7875 Transcript_3532/m.7875 type:complete len:88 (-) Transcript_3532:352-615(-)
MTVAQCCRCHLPLQLPCPKLKHPLQHRPKLHWCGRQRHPALIVKALMSKGKTTKATFSNVNNATLPPYLETPILIPSSLYTSAEPLC